MRSALTEEAAAYKEEVIERARGETARFLAVLGVYTDQAPEVTRERMYIQALEAVLTNSSKDYGGHRKQR